MRAVQSSHKTTLFGSSYQGVDSCVDVLVPKGTDPSAGWKVEGKVKKIFDKSARGYVFHLGGGRGTALKLPRERRTVLGLTHRFFVVQLRVPDGGPFTLELDFLDAARRRRRLVFSSAFKAVDRTELHVKVPLPLVALLPCGVWVDLVFDVHELAASSFGDGTPTKTAQRKSSRSAAATDAQTCFAALTAVTIGPTCTVRRIFTLGRSPAASAETSYGGDGDVSSAFASSGAIPAKHACPGGAQLCIVTMPSVVAALAALAPSTRAKVAPARRAGRNVAFGRRSSPAALVASGGGGGNTVGSARRARARPATAASRSRATASTRAPAAQQRQRPATTGSRTRPRNAGAASRTPALGAAARPRSRNAARERRATSSTAVRRAATS